MLLVSHLALLFDHCKEVGAVGGEAQEAVVEEEVALRHVFAEVALHDARVNKVFEEGGGFRRSGIATLGS